MSRVAAVNGTLVKKACKIFRNRCIDGGGGGVLENTAGVCTPSSTTDFGDKNMHLIARELEVVRFGCRFDEAPTIVVPFVMGFVVNMGGRSRNGRDNGQSKGQSIGFRGVVHIQQGEGRRCDPGVVHRATGLER
jgi:hypothetical protein